MPAPLVALKALKAMKAAKALKASKSLGSVDKALQTGKSANVGDMVKDSKKKPTKMPESKIDGEAARKAAYAGAKGALEKKDRRKKAIDKFITKGSAPKASVGMKLKKVPEGNKGKGLKGLPKFVRNKMGYAGKGMKYKAGGKVGNPFAMTKKEEDKSTVDVLKSDKKFVKNAKREEKKTQRVINRKGRGAEGLAKLQKQLRAKAKRKRKKQNRQQKRSNKRAARQLGRQMMAKRVGKALGRGNAPSAKEAGCQGAGCGAYE